MTLLSALALVMTIAAAVVHAPSHDQGPPVGQSMATAPASTPTPAPAAAPRPVALFVGDSFTAGTSVENPYDSYPQLIAREARLDLQLDAQGGTGFINDGRNTGNGDTSRLIDRLPQDAKRFPQVDILVVDAGRNDLQQPIGQLIEAMSTYLSAARAQWPNATIVLVFPSFVSAGSADGYQELLAGTQNILAAVGGKLVNPVADGWYANVAPQLLLDTDGVHPNEAGNTFIAEHLLEALRQLEIVSLP